jgi:hypothetical protein
MISNMKEVTDLTLGTNEIGKLENDWHVSDESNAKSVNDFNYKQQCASNWKDRGFELGSPSPRGAALTIADETPLPKHLTLGRYPLPGTDSQAG